MRFAYADPPYYGYAEKFYGKLHPEAAVYDSLDAHAKLIQRLQDEFPDGWALSMTSGNLHDILPLCPKTARVMAWVKPFCSFKPGVGVAYAWEPVVAMGGRRRTKQERTERDWCSVNITLKKGFTGAKPKGFCEWMFSMFNVRPEDEFMDLFPGSGAVTRAWEEYRSERGWDLV
jgi:hypothetical protein